MMKRTLLALLSTVVPLVVACGEDVGKCDDPNQGRDPVRVEGQIVFGGQAIMNQACAPCHGSKAKGASRRGAPAGLDFDLAPVEMGTPGQNDDGKAYVELTAADVNSLRARQRKVYDDRNDIWEQIKSGLMPPDGIGLGYRRAVATIFKTLSSDGGTELCTGSEKYADITQKSSQEVLRNWLACGAPIVESNNSTVTDKGGVAGAVGYQYPSCSLVPVDDGGMDTQITIELVQSTVFNSCAPSCHEAGGIFEKLDLSSAEKSYAALVQNTAVQCIQSGDPYVKKMDPMGSFLYDTVSKEVPSCNAPRMPYGQDPLSTAQIELIRDWIQGGALRESDVQKSKALGPLGIDAGLR